MSGTLILGEAVSAEEFARLMQAFSPLSGKIALAVSGGADSMALALCTKRWAQQASVALIIDHALRTESAAEAVKVQARLAQIGMPSVILRWEHEGITAGLHEKARAARYRLLAEACRAHGCGDLLLAQHRDDQAETILMRIAKGSGVEGLAGIAAQSWREDIRLLRPFLSLEKRQLIATCQAAHLDFVTDPSNGSDRYARGRLRAIIPLLAKEGLTTANLIRLGTRAAEADAALAQATTDFLQQAAHPQIGGSVRLNRAALCSIPRAIALRALSECLRYVHPADYPPPYDGLSELFAASMTATGNTGRSFYGTLVTTATNHISILREPAAASEILPLRPGETVLWDKRWTVSAEKSALGGVLRALGCAPHDVIDDLAPRLRHLVPQGRVRATLPALWTGERITAIPSFDEKDGFRLSYRKRAFPSSR